MKVTYDKETNEPTWEVDPTIKHPATLTAVIPKLSGETVTVAEWFKDKIKGVLNLKDATIDPYIYSGTPVSYTHLPPLWLTLGLPLKRRTPLPEN